MLWTREFAGRNTHDIQSCCTKVIFQNTCDHITELDASLDVKSQFLQCGFRTDILHGQPKQRIKPVNKVNNRTETQDLITKVAVYSLGVRSDDKDFSKPTELAKKKKLVISW